MAWPKEVVLQSPGAGSDDHAFRQRLVPSRTCWATAGVTHSGAGRRTGGVTNSLFVLHCAFFTKSPKGLSLDDAEKRFLLEGTLLRQAQGNLDSHGNISLFGKRKILYHKLSYD